MTRINQPEPMTLAGSIGGRCARSPGAGAAPGATGAGSEAAHGAATVASGAGAAWAIRARRGILSWLAMENAMKKDDDWGVALF